MIVALHNIDDCVGFVKMSIKRSRIYYADADEYEEMLCEGLAILVDLANRYDATREHDGRNRFYGYAYYLLPRKLKDAWHRSHEEHILRTQPDGTRRYEYMQRAVSWDGLLEIEDGPGLDERSLRTPGEFIPLPKTARARAS
jgi:hypothetical protein